MSERTHDDDGGIDLSSIEPGNAAVLTPDIDGPDVEIAIHGAAPGEPGPMLFDVDVDGHGFYIYGLAGINEESDRFVVAADSPHNTYAEAAIEAIGGEVRR
jgi:hypothetical protein